MLYDHCEMFKCYFITVVAHKYKLCEYILYIRGPGERLRVLIKRTYHQFLEGGGSIPGWGGGFSPLMIPILAGLVVGCLFFQVHGLLPRLLGTGPFNCTFKILTHRITEEQN